MGKDGGLGHLEWMKDLEANEKKKKKKKNMLLAFG